MAVFIKTAGNRSYFGTNAEYDQVDYPGDLMDYTFTRNDNGTVTVTHPQLGTDTLSSIEGFWFNGERTWYSMDDAIALTNGQASPNLVGTNADDVLIGSGVDNMFIGGRGDDIIDGNGGAYNQVDYAGALSDYEFTQNDDGTVTVEHDVWGEDTLTDIDGFWFQGEAAWYSMADALALAPGGPATGPSGGTMIGGIYTGTQGNDVLTGSDTGTTFYSLRGNDTIIGMSDNDTLNVDGNVTEWTFTEIDEDTIEMSHAMWGVKTIEDIDNIWFGRAGEAMSVEDAMEATANLPVFRMDADGVLNGTPGDDVMTGNWTNNNFYGGLGDDSYNGRNGFDQVNYDGARADYNISANADGSFTVSHAVWGTDTLTNIEGLYFSGSGEWIGTDSLV